MSLSIFNWRKKCNLNGIIDNAHLNFYFFVYIMYDIHIITDLSGLAYTFIERMFGILVTRFRFVGDILLCYV